MAKVHGKNRRKRKGIDMGAMLERRPPVSLSSPEIHYLEKRLARLVKIARATEQDLVDRSRYPDADALVSARNFAGYLGVRRHDLRKVQRSLRDIGLNPLGHIETDTLDSLRRISAALTSLRGGKAKVPREAAKQRSGEQILSDRASAILGPEPEGRSARVMVTMPTEAAGNYELVRDLVASGTGIVRITCAHDGPAEWERMIEHTRRAERELGRKCLVLVDLSGPKLRTGPIERGLAVLSWRPFKNSVGEVIEPARIWLSSSVPAPELANASLPVDQPFHQSLQIGDEIHFQDDRDRKRTLIVKEVLEDGAWAEASKKAALVEGIRLAVKREGRDALTGVVGPITSVPQRLSLKVGDPLVLTRSEVMGKAAVYGKGGRLRSPNQIGCSLPEVFRDAQAGQRIFFDDGKIAGTIEKVKAREIHVRITWTRGPRAWLSEEKGINIPDTDLKVSALTAKDMDDLAFLLRKPAFVDIVGMSFIKTREDVQSFFAALESLGAGNVAALVKIENSAAFENLPEIILAILERTGAGVMIARGDLGVEAGFERMAELQEEILFLCNAAHLPVVWATQVLETLAKKGMPSRAEVSDAVMAARTQCVMLNKGPYIRIAVRFLIDVLERMEGHQDGPFRLMRKLNVAGRPTHR